MLSFCIWGFNLNDEIIVYQVENSALQQPEPEINNIDTIVSNWTVKTQSVVLLENLVTWKLIEF